MTENFPELQSLSKLYDLAMFAKEKESKEKKHVLEKLGKTVIKEKNKQLGIKDTAASFFSSDSAKYFEYLDNGQGEYLTVDEAKKKGLSDAQIEFLKFMRELVAEREGYLGDFDIYNTPMEVVKTDKGFKETYKSDGITAAFSHLLGDTYNISNVRIPYTDPTTGKEDVTEFKNIEKKLIDYGKTGLVPMIKSLKLMFQYNVKARKQLKTGKNYDQKGLLNELKIVKGGDYTLDGNGNLIGKFDRKRDKSRGYSKDFYKAAMSYIDDTAHVKHLTPLMPVINSIEYINKHGVEDEKGETLHGKKTEVVNWLNEWRDMHIFKKDKETIPELDMLLKTMRFLTSATTMWFNVLAGILNASIGLYNNWRAENGPIIRKGNKRLFSDNKYSVALLKKYNAVSTDLDSNPKIFEGRILDGLATGLTRYGEFLVQGSGVLGLMSEDEFNSFEFKKDKHGVEQLIVKEGVDEKKLEEKMLSYRNRISDIQGKYAEKDRRNIMNNELGKALMQFKVWVPDWFKERFGEEYITADGAIHKGSWHSLMKDGFKDLRESIKKDGVKAIWNDKAAMSNLKGLMAVALLYSLVNMDDDDDEKSKTALLLQRALGDVLFVFDTNNLRFTVSKPIAAMGAVTKFVDIADHLMAFDEDDYYKRTGKPKIMGDIIGIMPGKKLIQAGVDLISDDE